LEELTLRVLFSIFVPMAEVCVCETESLVTGNGVPKISARRVGGVQTENYITYSLRSYADRHGVFRIEEYFKMRSTL
jgi:hypothetical protein